MVFKFISVELNLLRVLLLGLGDELGVVDGGWWQALLRRGLLLQVAATVDWYNAPGSTLQVVHFLLARGALLPSGSASSAQPLAHLQRSAH